MEGFTGVIMQLCVLILIAGTINIFAPKLKLPYTVLLFIAGALIAQLLHLEHLEFLKSFSLTPELLFYVFLPMLLFEAAYKMKYSEVSENKYSTWGLATIGLLISTSLISLLGILFTKLIGFNLPIEVIILFAVIIGTTDPVAVMALFKEYGAPKRLSYIFEGESSFNDGTGLALFLIIYEIFRSGIFSTGALVQGFLQFLCMIIGGILLGSFFGIAFSHIIKSIKNNLFVEIAFSVIIAHIVFLVSELISHSLVIGDFHVKISGVIATVFAGIIIGNYGKTKFSPKVEKYMDSFWGFFGFLSNSLVFLLIGMIVYQINLPWLKILPIVLALILATTIARAASVYITIGGLNKLKLEDHIPIAWQHLLAWGSLRGALAFMIALLIDDNFSISGWPFEFSIKEFLLGAIILKIAYTLLVKATTIPLLIKKLGIDTQDSVQQFETLLGEIVVLNKLENKILSQKNYNVSSQIQQNLENNYHQKLKYYIDQMKDFCAKNDNIIILKGLRLQCTQLQKKYLEKMLEFGEVSENNYIKILQSLEIQEHKIEKGDLGTNFKIQNYDIIRKINFYLNRHGSEYFEKYTKYRAKKILAKKSLDYLYSLKNIQVGFDKSLIDEIINIYEGFVDFYEKKIETLQSRFDKNQLQSIDEHLYEKGALKAYEGFLSQAYENGILPSGIYENEKIKIENEIEKPFIGGKI